MGYDLFILGYLIFVRLQAGIAGPIRLPTKHLVVPARKFAVWRQRQVSRFDRDQTFFRQRAACSV